MKIAVVDYGLANIRSVVNAISCFSVDMYLAEQGKDLAQADKIILPGVGSFDKGMQGLKERGHVAALNELVLRQKKPCLGICLGFQFLFEGSDEGQESGLGWLKGRALSFDKKSVKVPHIGWNELMVRENSMILNALDSTVDVYFVHSYYVPAVGDVTEYAVGICDYGIKFVAAVEKDNIFGTQFHPEKSQLAGMKMIENFLTCDVTEPSIA